MSFKRKSLGLGGKFLVLMESLKATARVRQGEGSKCSSDVKLASLVTFTSIRPDWEGHRPVKSPEKGGRTMPAQRSVGLSAWPEQKAWA